eukprot:SRR837773.8059.p2 GENE.SRR837773.8059~~SRR837773.8059.p2  ORF type:complete len:131 (+),score=12.20 SRR837773.8059:44-436(+)
MAAMLEQLSRAGPALARPSTSEDASPPLAAIVELQEGGNAVLARIEGTGQHFSLFVLHRQPRAGAGGTTLETVEARKQVASGDVVVTAITWLTIFQRDHLLCIGFSHGGVSILHLAVRSACPSWSTGERF